MTKKEAFEKIKRLLFSEETKFGNAKLADGTIVQWEGDMGEGVAVNVVDTEGNMMPAPDGTHELEDGTFVTTVGGLVTKIESAKKEEEEAETESEMEKMFAEFAEQFKALQAEVETFKAQLAGYDEKFASLETTKADTDGKFSAILEAVKEISEEPAAEIEAPKNTGFKVSKKETAAEKINRYINSKK